MSSAACKALLTQTYPATQARDWKREDKKTSSTGAIVRLFYHHEKESVTIIENNGHLYLKPGLELDFVMYQANQSSMCMIYMAHKHLLPSESIKMVTMGVDFLYHMILFKHLVHYKDHYYYCSMDVADKVFRTLQHCGLTYNPQLMQNSDLLYYVARGTLSSITDKHLRTNRMLPTVNAITLVSELNIFDAQREQWSILDSTLTAPLHM